MIDFQNAKYIKLRRVEDDAYAKHINPLLTTDEEIISSYKAVRDGIVFTNKRILIINIQGITGKKKEFTTLPYCKIQAFSVETSGAVDLDSELDLWFSAVGQVSFQFSANANIHDICRYISQYAL